MKYLLSILFVVIVLFSIPQHAQAIGGKVTEVRLNKGGSVFTYSCSIDSTANDTSRSFQLDGYLTDSLTQQPAVFGVIHSSVAGVSAMKFYLQGSLDGTNWYPIKTLFGASTPDSVETYQVVSGYLNSLYAAYYRIISDGQAGNRSDCLVKWQVFVRKRE